MPLQHSEMVDLGTDAPFFKLLNVMNGQTVALSDFRPDKPLVVIFSCNHCPYVLFIQTQLCELAKKYQSQGCNFVLISSNDIDKYPQDAPELMREFAQSYNFSFPYLYDETQSVARAYRAACTPDIYVYDKIDNNNRKLAYRGQFCPARPSNGLIPNGQDLAAALTALLNNETVNSRQYPSAGCSIKWKE